MWTAIAIAMLAFPLYVQLADVVTVWRRREQWRGFWRPFADDLRMAAAQCLLQVTFLANQAWDMLHAIVLTLVRLIVTRRRLLEWETADSVSLRSVRGRIAFLTQMVASPVIALAGLLAVLVIRRGALPAAAPIIALWFAAPFIAFALSRPMTRRRLELDTADRAYLRGIALATWRYFDAFAGPGDHGLPPDGVQIVPSMRTAHRTSPTNIGMGLLSTLAAHDLGFITTDQAIDKLEAAMTTLESLERFEGHLFNWYDTETLAPLHPRYVSTVDSGNLAGALVVLAVGVGELAAT
jgi:cyclic beta-1,2-glucan synthetase